MCGSGGFRRERECQPILRDAATDMQSGFIAVQPSCWTVAPTFLSASYEHSCLVDRKVWRSHNAPKTGVAELGMRRFLTSQLLWLFSHSSADLTPTRLRRVRGRTSPSDQTIRFANLLSACPRTPGVTREFVMKRELPPRPNLDQLRTRPRTFANPQSGDSEAIQRILPSSASGQNSRRKPPLLPQRRQRDRPRIRVASWPG